MKRRPTFVSGVVFLIGLISFPLLASIEDYFPQTTLDSPSNYGETGLMELPNAKFMEPASLRLNFSASFPNEYTGVTATPFSWLEASYRYAEIKNKLYGPAAYSGNQSWKDKGFDLKIKLLNENFYLPAVAVGLRDIAGNGNFSSEYIVATKSFGNLDVTTGIGFGILGSDNSIRNPFISIDEGFKSRSGDFGLGGDFRVSNWFSGPASIFGGLEYNIRKYGLKFIAEYDTSNPDMSAFNPMPVKSRFNLGMNYSISDSLQLRAAFERGSNFRIGFALKGNFYEDTIPKAGPKNVISLDKERKKKIESNPQIFYRSLNKSLRDESLYIQAAALEEKEASVAVASTKFNSVVRTAGRSARIVSALAPDEVDRINVHVMNGTFEVSTFHINRDKFDAANQSRGSPAEVLKRSSLSSNSNEPLTNDPEFDLKYKFPEFYWSMAPGLKHQIGGPEGFYLGQLYWRTDTTIKFSRYLSLQTSFGINLYDTFDDFNNPSQSTIPKVRSDIQDYLDQGKNNIQRMQLQYMYSPIKDVYTRADFGYLEEMFGGVGGEVLYRPFSKNYAIGFALHRVKQRGYKQRFSFKEYETTTGHLTTYYDFPYGISSSLSIGKYLAGDKGATWDLSRRFKTGFTLGIFATKTNLSAIEFGEGSFDKGFYIAVPTSLFYSDFRAGNITFGLQPLTKDGGAKLAMHNQLYGLLGDTNERSILRDWNYLLD
tara:strand:+ start:4717 stop:6852 length:2136 start_codon:yes stop_codon:yes gene_type:complete